MCVFACLRACFCVCVKERERERCGNGSLKEVSVRQKCSCDHGKVKWRFEENLED